jgi:hypothetical protein
MADTSFDVIPSIDLIDGKCVRLRQGNFEEVTQFADDPLVIAQQFEEAGLKRLHVVDLDGARAREVRHWHVLELLAKETSLKIDFSGGFTTLAEVERALNLGAQQVAIGSLAVRDAALFTQIDPAEFHCSPLPMCDGVIRCEHGLLASPPPAVQEMLAGVPVYGADAQGETVTPTALAFLKAAGARFGKWPQCEIVTSARAYGGKVFETLPNGANFFLVTL